MGNFLKKLFGSSNDAEIKRLRKTLDKVNALEAEIHALSDEELQAKTPAFKQRLANGETLDALLPEAFAVVREAAQRTLGQRPFDVQVLGGIVPHQGRIAEMKTGEGKTITCVMPAYLNALTGKGVHIVTVNDYLAKYQGEMMRQDLPFPGHVRWDRFSTAWIRSSAASPMPAISSTARTTNSALTTCATTWWCARRIWFSAS